MKTRMNWTHSRIDFGINEYAIIDETKHETTFIKPQVRWQYGALYIGLAIWLSIRTVDFFKVLFIENHDPMPLSVSAMPVLALVLGTGVTIVLAVLGVQQFVGSAGKHQRINKSESQPSGLSQT